MAGQRKPKRLFLARLPRRFAEEWVKIRWRLGGRRQINLCGCQRGVFRANLRRIGQPLGDHSLPSVFKFREFEDRKFTG